MKFLKKLKNENFQENFESFRANFQFTTLIQDNHQENLMVFFDLVDHTNITRI
jgi:hypothetical protein